MGVGRESGFTVTRPDAGGFWIKKRRLGRTRGGRETWICPHGLVSGKGCLERCSPPRRRKA